MINLPRNTFFKVFLSLLLLLVFLLSLLTVFSTPIVNRLVDQLENDEFEIQIGRVSLSPFQDHLLSFNDIEVGIGEEKQSYWQVHISQVAVDLILAPLLNKQVKINDLSLSNMKVKLSETIPLLKTKKIEKEVTIPEWIEIKNLKISNSQFTYISHDRKAQRPDGKIKFEDINVISQELSKARLAELGFEFQAKGKMGPTKISLELMIQNFKQSRKIELKSKVYGAALEEMNSYLEPTEGLKISGNLHEAYSHSIMKGNKIVSKVRLDYNDLTVDVIPNHDRGEIESLISDWALNAKICDSNQKRSGIKQLNTSESQKGEESIVQFILNGLLESALKGACFS